MRYHPGAGVLKKGVHVAINVKKEAEGSKSQTESEIESTKVKPKNEVQNSVEVPSPATSERNAGDGENRTEESVLSMTRKLSLNNLMNMRNNLKEAAITWLPPEEASLHSMLERAAELVKLTLEAEREDKQRR